MIFSSSSEKHIYWSWPLEKLKTRREGNMLAVENVLKTPKNFNDSILSFLTEIIVDTLV
jgi:hypothetical protein